VGNIKNNLLFCENERRIIISYLNLVEKNGVLVSFKELAKSSQLGRATIYRHFGSVRDIQTKINRGVLDEWDHRLRREIDRGFDIRRVFKKLLVFIFLHQTVFRAGLRTGSVNYFYLLICSFKDQLLKMWQGYNADIKDEAFKMFAYEIVAILVSWGERGFKEEEINTLVSRIIWELNSAKWLPRRIIKAKDL
jgi:AcrR family transcriptional regulator